MAENQIQTVNYRHEAIINWMLTNPHRPLKDCAEELGYTQAWLSTIIHSDMFQEAYQVRCRDAGLTAIHTMRNRVTGVAALALGKLEDRLEREGKNEPSENFLVNTTKTLLAAAGFSAGDGNASQHLHLHIPVDPAVLSQARERAAQFHSSPIVDAVAGS